MKALWKEPKNAALSFLSVTEGKSQSWMLTWGNESVDYSSYNLGQRNKTTPPHVQEFMINWRLTQSASFFPSLITKMIILVFFQLWVFFLSRPRINGLLQELNSKRDLLFWWIWYGLGITGQQINIQIKIKKINISAGVISCVRSSLSVILYWGIKASYFLKLQETKNEWTRSIGYSKKSSLHWTGFAVEQTVICCINKNANWDKQTLKRWEGRWRTERIFLFPFSFFNTSNMDHFIGYQPNLI